jgi:hypothetical protein
LEKSANQHAPSSTIWMLRWWIKSSATALLYL